jgi:adenylate cyclase
MFRIARDPMNEALRLFERAIERDPNYGAALAMASICHLRLAEDFREDFKQNQDRAIRRAQRALEVAPDDPVSLANAPFTLAWCGEDIEAMLALIDRALRLNPSYARGWYVSATVRVWAGEPETTIEHIKRSARLSPRDRMGPHDYLSGLASLLCGRLDEARAKLLLAMRENPGYPRPYTMLAICFAHMGRLDEARAMILRVRELAPATTVPNVTMFRLREHREFLLSGLRLAMGEAG